MTWLTQPPTLSANGNKYWSRDSGSALRWKVTVDLALHQPSVTGSVIISTYRLNELRKGDEHPTYTPVRCIALCYFNFIFSEVIH